MTGSIRFVSATVQKIMDLVAEEKMSEEVAVELVNTMQANGFATNHDVFFESVKKMIHKIASKEYES